MPLEQRHRDRFKDDVVKVDLRAAHIRDTHIPDIVALLKQYPNIVSLDLSRNDLFFMDKNLLRELTALEQLQELNLGETHFLTQEEEKAVNYLLTMKNLRSLDVRATYITEASAKKLAAKEGLLVLALGARYLDNDNMSKKTFYDIQDQFSSSNYNQWMATLNKMQADLIAKKQAQQQSSINHLNDREAMEAAKQLDYSPRDQTSSSIATFERTASNESQSDSSGDSPQQTGRGSSDAYDELRNKQREKDASALVSLEKKLGAEEDREITPVNSNSPGKSS